MFSEITHGQDRFPQLKRFRLSSGYWFMAGPYSAYLAGIDRAFADHCEVAGALIASGVNVYSPVAHSHPICTAGHLDHYDHDLWIPLEEPFLENAHGLLVIEMPGWDESVGVKHEIEWFKARKRPVEHLTYPELRPIL